MSAGASKLSALLATILLTWTLVAAAPAAADTNQCKPSGKEGALALPRDLATANRSQEKDTHTTADVEPLSSVNIDALGLHTPGTLTVGTQSGGPPTSCLNSAGRYTGYDNELLRAIAAKLGLRIAFAGTEFAGLLAQVAGRRFDVASASIVATEKRRRTVGFTNGYDFGYLSLIVPSGSRIGSFDDLRAGQRIGVVQGTVEEAYVVDALHLEPVKFPDFTTLYTCVKTHQIDAWVAPAVEAMKVLKPGDTAGIADYTFGLGSFIAYPVAKDNQPLIDALNAGLDAVIADGTWSQLYTDWVPRALPQGWKPGSKAAPTPHLPDFAAIASQHRHLGEAAPPKSVWAQLADSFFDWDLYKQAIPKMVTTGLPNTLILTVSSERHRSGGGHGACGGRDFADPLAALAGAGLHRHLPRLARGGDHSADRARNRAHRGRIDEQQPVSAGHRGAGADRGGLHRRDLPLRNPKRRDRAARRRPGVGAEHRTAMRLVVIPQGIRRVLPALVNQFIALLKGSALVYFLGLIAGQRELFQVGRDLNAQTGSLSPLVAAGLFYLLLTIPLTHLVNVVDRRLRDGRPATEPGRSVCVGR